MAITQYRDRNWLAPWREIDQVTRQLNRFFNDAGIATWRAPIGCRR